MTSASPAASSTTEREFAGRQAPWSNEAEQAVLGAMLLDQGGVLIEQHGAEDSLLGLVAPGGLAAGELALSRRGCGGRCRRHPPAGSSRLGWAGGRAGETLTSTGC